MRNSIGKLSSLVKRGKGIKKGGIKLPIAMLLLAMLVVGGGIGYKAWADPITVVTSATGAEAVSIDTTSDGGSGTWTYLSGPKIEESNAGDIAIGTHTMTLPIGWEFDVSQNVNIGLTSGGAAGLVLHTYIVTPTVTTLSFTVTVISTNSAETLTFNNIKVRPTNTSVGSGDITMTVGTIIGVDGDTNFGTLTTVAGIVTQVAFTTQPGDAVYGSNLNPQPVVKTQDQFGNNSTVGLAISKDVTLVLTGTGALLGTATIDIGTSAGNGTVTFTDLTVDEVGIENQLTASATGLASDDSDLFDITQKPINVTAQTDTKTYDGNANSSAIPVVDQLAFGDTIATVPTQVFDNENVDIGKTLTASGLLITDGNSNYTITYVPNTTGVIEAKELTVTGATITSKTYDGTTVAVILGATLNGVITGDVGTVTLENYTLGTFNNKNVGTNKTVTTAMTLIGTGTGNYTLTQPILTGNITKKAITVTATANEKVYDNNNTAVALPTVTDGGLAGGDVGVYAETYDDQNVGTTKTLTPTVISIKDASNVDMTGNYTVTLTPVDLGKITEAPLTATITAKDKKYDGNTNAEITGYALSGIIGSDTVIPNGGTATFDNKNIGTGKIVSAIGITLTGNDAGNYIYDGTAAGTADIIAKEITITPTAGQTKVYGDSDSIFAYIKTPLVSGELLTGALSREVGEDVGNYAYTIGSLTAGTNYTLTLALETFGITERPITVTAVTDSKTYDGLNSSNKTPTITLGTLAFSDSASFTQTYDNVNVGINKTITPSVTISDGNSGNNYDVSYVDDTTGVIEAKEIIITPTAGQTKVYGETDPTSFDYSFNPALISPDTFTGALSRDANENVGNYAYTLGNLSAGANYTLTLESGTFGITVKNLTVNATTNSKVYDGNTTATITIGNSALNGIVDSEDVTLDSTNYSAIFDTKHIGINKTVTVSGLALSGGGKSNYSITQPVLTDGVIIIKAINVTAKTDTKVYDGTTDSNESPVVDTLAPGDDIATDPIQEFDHKDVGSRTLIPSGLVINDGNSGNNYAVVPVTAIGEITAKTITATITASNKPYDGNANAMILTRTLVDTVSGDIVDATGGTATFASENVGTHIVSATGITLEGTDKGNYSYNGTATGEASITEKEITITPDNLQSKIYGDSDLIFTYTYAPALETGDNFEGALSRVAGEDVGNYAYTIGNLTAGTNYTLALTSETFGITERPITVTPVANTKVYNKTTVVATEPTITFGTLVANDVAVFSATYDDVNVGSTKTLTPTVTSIVDNLSVDMTGNYNVTLVTANVGEITAKAVDITAQSDTKTYDGDATSSVSPKGDALESTDTWASEGAQIFSQSDVGDNLILTASGASIADGNSGNNYVIYYVTDTTGSITAKEIIITPNASQTKTYDEVDPTFDYTNDTLVGSDSISGDLGRVAGENVGTYAFSIGTLDAGTNYNLSVAAVPTFSITPLSITGNFTADNKTYDGNTDAVILTQTLNGVINQDNVTLTGGTASFADANVADDITVTASGMTLSGTPAGNYSLASVDDTTANISAVSLEITADSKTKEFDDADPTLTYQLTSGTLIDSSITGSLTRDIGEAVGVYTINQGTVTAGSNYNITYISGTLTIQDTTAPIITDKTPIGTTSDTTPVISANYSDVGSDINIATAIIKIDGTQIPEGFYTKTGEGISYALLNPLSYDFHTVYIEVEDSLSNKATTEWTFQIAEIDEVAPTANQDPINGSANVAITINPYIDFSEAMNEASLNNNVKLKTYNSVVVPASYNITTNGNGTTRVTIIPDADLDYNTQYYFYIDNNVEDLAGNKIATSSWYADQKDSHEFTTAPENHPATSYDISLNKGWNLISLPLIPNDSDIETVLSGIADNLGEVRYYENNDWQYYKDGEIEGDLMSMEDGKGYWIFMDEGDILTIAGTEMPAGGEAPASYSVVGNKWNLIGFKSVSSMSVKEYIGNQIGSSDVLWAYKNGVWEQTYPLSSDDIMEPGYGYWLYPYGNGYEIIPTN